MISLKQYQTEAVEGLLKETFNLLDIPGARLKLVFKAPTGAGKTIVMASYLNKLCEELPDKLSLSQKNLAFVWIAPNSLHIQSYWAFKKFFKELKSIKPINFDDITNGKLMPNEVLFLNWQSINKESNTIIKENEYDRTILAYINKAKLDDTEIIVILDEAHLFASKGKAASELLQKIFSKIEIDVSATPYYSSDYSYTIKRQEVIDAQMIKKGIILNPDLDEEKQNGKTLNEILLDVSIKKRNDLINAYKNSGTDINPLLLIQLPNDNKNESILDTKIKDELILLLEKKGINTSNNKLGIWLSNTKTNLEDIEQKDSLVDVLIFKQAIALGWDCPRAAILLIFREIQQKEFTIQTVGRILRMPEHKHYNEPILNYGYVFTNISKEIISIVKDDMSYFIMNKSKRVITYEQIKLKSSFINTRLTRNRLSSKFRKCFYEAAENYLIVTKELFKTTAQSTYLDNLVKLKEHFINCNLEDIRIPIPKDVNLKVEIGYTIANEMINFAKTQSELDILFRQFCRQHVGNYAKIDSTPILELTLKMFFEEYLNINEESAIKIILNEQNKPKFIEIIDRALLLHERLIEQNASLATKTVDISYWGVPKERNYNDNYEDIITYNNVMEPFYQSKTASKPERKFANFLSNNKSSIEWWYKNGDQNKEDFAITYFDREGILRGFYVDFIIKLKHGKTALFDTKTLNSDPEFINKHNSLIKYISEQNINGAQLLGGIIIEKDENVWKYSDKPISSSKLIQDWISFDPQLITHD